MARKTSFTNKSFVSAKSAVTRAPAPAAAPVSSPVRNSAIPKMAPLKREISHEQIAKRAYEIYRSGKGGSQIDNWLRAERELRGS